MVCMVYGYIIHIYLSLPQANPGDVVQFAFGDAREAQSIVVVEKRKVPKIGVLLLVLVWRDFS